jgi:molybdenum cofactor biosynthesis protein B
LGAEEHREKAPKSARFAVITISDTRTVRDDLSGKAVIELMEAGGHESVKKVIVRDEASEIQRALREMIEDPRVQAIVMNGGTGISKRDVTLEAVARFEEKQIPGFGELFRALSYKEIGSAAMMSRAVAFVSESKIVFCLPGSEKAVRMAVSQLIAPELGHMVWEANR